MPTNDSKHLLAYKILAHLQWGSSPWVNRYVDGRIVIQTSPWARSLRMSSSQVRANLEWLADEGWITGAKIKYGSAEVFLLRPLPANLMADLGREILNA